MIELTDEMARKIERASQILSGLTRAASKNGGGIRRNPGLHSEILDLRSELRDVGHQGWDYPTFLRTPRVAHRLTSVSGKGSSTERTISGVGPSA